MDCSGGMRHIESKGSSMDTPIIMASGLAKTYGRGRKRIEAVKGIDLQIRRGEIFGLVGPDGAGKTTTIQVLCGILTPSDGQAVVAGVDVIKEAHHLGGKIGYMSEGFTLYGTLTVDENIDFFAQLYKVPSDEVASRKEKLLRFARLEEAHDRRAENLSGGMKKKLALACTLIYQPEVLFLDEPTTGVDPASRQDFWTILYEFLAEGITIFVSTPYMDEAERCHHVALMREGQIVAQDTPTGLKQLVPGVSVDLTAHPQLEAVTRLRQMTDVVRQVQVFGERLHVVLNNNHVAPEQLTNRLKADGVTVTGVQTTPPSLEDVFIAAIEDMRQADDSKPDVISSALPSGTTHAPSETLAVSVKNLTRRFGTFTAVDGISLDVQPGEIFGFLGPNGSGKTTTIRMLCGLLPPTSGKATVAGFDITRQRSDMKTRIGYMSQKFSLYNDLTVAENIQFFGNLYGLLGQHLHERRQWVLEMAGLVGKEHLKVRNLSGGWKQRLALGCAVLHEPEILFLDEPTSGVDPLARREFWDLIFSLSSQGVTVFVATHYMDEAEHCHQLGLLYRGRIIARGSPAELRLNMKLGQLLEIPVRDPLAALPFVATLPENIQTSIFGDRLHALVWDADTGQQAVSQVLHPHHLITGPIQHVPISLEDLFMLFIEMEEEGRLVRSTT
jgi:ABC-2 type transport system ATP-binding protein